MIQGSYKFKVKVVDTMECPNAYPILNNRARTLRNNYKTCGSGALALLTGIDAYTIEKKLPKTAEHWSDLSLIKFLKSKKFEVVQISKLGITNLSPRAEDGEWDNEPITHNHVLLCNSLMCRDEASWWIINNNRTFHNLRENTLNPLFFMNKPSQSVYLVAHKYWK